MRRDRMQKREGDVGVAIEIAGFDEYSKFERPAALRGSAGRSHARGCAQRNHERGNHANRLEAEKIGSRAPRRRAKVSVHLQTAHVELRSRGCPGFLVQCTCPFCQSSNCPNSSFFWSAVRGAPPDACWRSSIKREKIDLRS